MSITCKSITFADSIATGKGLKVCSERAEGDSFNPHCFINGCNDVQVQTAPFLSGTDNEGDVFCKTLSFYFSLKEHGCSISKATQPTDEDPDADDGFDAKEFDDVLQHFRSDHQQLLRLVLLAGRDGEQRWFGGWRDLDCSAPRVRWLRTPLRGKAEVQGTRLSKPEKKGTHPIGNSRGIAVQVGRLLTGSGKALDTFLCPLHESGLVKGERM